MRIPGIVIGASTLSSRVSVLHLACRQCQFTTEMTVDGGFSSLQIPRVCGRLVHVSLWLAAQT